jgi:hypothetical protein
MKLGEFIALNQGTKTVTQYLHAFNNLCHYAPDMVDTDAKRIASFKRGLNPKMMKHVGTNTRTRFNDFISDCLKQKKNNNATTAAKSHKSSLEGGPSQARAPAEVILPITHPHLALGSGHHNREVRISRVHKSLIRWQ